MIVANYCRDGFNVCFPTEILTNRYESELIPLIKSTIFKRLPKARYGIRTLFSPSLPLAEEVSKKFEKLGLTVNRVIMVNGEEVPVKSFNSESWDTVWYEEMKIWKEA